MMVLSRLLGKKSRIRKSSGQLLSSASQQSRHPAFYSDRGLSDSLDGRFESITLHIALIMRRLKSVQPSGAALAEDLCTALFSSFDHAFREMGTSDVAIARKIRQLGEAYAGRVAAYNDSLSSEDALQSLEAAILRNVFGGDSTRDAAQFAKYTLAADTALAKQSDDAVWNGQINWPDPADILN